MYIRCSVRHPSVKRYLCLYLIEIWAVKTVLNCVRHSKPGKRVITQDFTGWRQQRERRRLTEALKSSSMVLQRSAITHHQSHSHGGQSCHQIGITDRQADRRTTSQPGGNSWQELRVWRMDGWTKARPQQPRGGLDERSQMSLRVITTSTWLYGMI